MTTADAARAGKIPASLRKRLDSLRRDADALETELKRRAAK